MIHFTKDLMTQDVKYIAISGGIDSMVCLDFLSRGNHDVTPIYVNHLTDFGNKMAAIIRDHVYDRHKKRCIVCTIEAPYKKSSLSQEEYWRNERYKIFLGLEHKIILCHQLDDNIETWLLTSLTGHGRLMPWKRDNIVRPFLLCSRNDIKEWAIKYNVVYWDDPSNESMIHARNIVRHKMMPIVEEINPGIKKVIRKKLIESRKEIYIT